MAEDTEKVRSMSVVGREQHAVTPDSFHFHHSEHMVGAKNVTRADGRALARRLLSPAPGALVRTPGADEDAEVPSAG